ncbi:ribosome biogenesis GTPase YlqF [Desertifilum sp. FACHB-1129]|uniref:Ribosome biogenesis GTPase A n=1 Tax=Desertifilum tharense IPPAS B-1220 TaxID=1781255 RepID=A0A1E5QK08_9CYAN|nr:MULTISPECIES: ribosome biogenesis GTPase YlqF [Desertifilum]MDA0210453.1 ribosome biogenesis GTPase YlqF [Cyanobacteria bacterium FC1]MBD2313910.1 ribosome biogenesis GTPase YlqF [Desertifilum sp. FACHB-1129]MBD2324741.1 ribosome biogenesis GTPase YlqF [Desertifilum sp. FACHB-866]MBD2334865.1 ribosome biogenesis GTPase YlqF [Desertifilum sp. FACHB-868]OEJ75012.1 ribosome biogenesis GTPase YlqF [Desertifilum tharense IPPAS B-1220]
MSIQWYPGHIAKAEKALKEQLKRVDVVLEVRDARIPLATEHPQVKQWVGEKGRVLTLNRLDTIPPAVQQRWTEWFESMGEPVYFTNAKLGKGISGVTQAAQRAGEAMNQRRRDRGMLPRPVRAVVIGFPNVGKSALINRLLGRRVVESAARPGVTRQLRWVRISEAIELLDAPGIIPAKLENQEDALKLAICDDIGEASYDNQRVAVGLLELLQHLSAEVDTLGGLRSRYGELDLTQLSAESYLAALAETRFLGDVERTARQLLADFRKGLLGAVPLELPPS